MHCPLCAATVPDTANHCPVCGSPLGSQAIPGGTVLQGKYRVDAVLGQGGFGITYAATQVLLGAQVAIKELFPGGTVRQRTTVHPPSTLDPAGWQQAKRDFTEEARILARFNHPDIVRVLDLFEEGGTAYMVMERLEGQSLQSRLEAQGALPAAEVLHIATRTAEALRLIHDAGLLHRDLKPDNIFLEQSGRIVLIDFGSARGYTAGQTVRHTRLVTPGYAPMEQYGNSAKFGPYTDLYALGATLHHALTGYMPPSAPDLMTGAPLPLLPVGTPAGLRRATEQAMSNRVADRPQTAQAFLSLLGQSAAPQPPVPPLPPPQPTPHLPPSPVPGPGPARSARWGLVWPLIAVAAVGFGALRWLSAPTPAAASGPGEQNAAAAPAPANRSASDPGGTGFAIVGPAAGSTVPAGGFNLSGQGSPGDTLEISEGAVSLGRVSVDQDRFWIFSVPGSTPGIHHYRVTGEDGNELGTLEVVVGRTEPAEQVSAGISAGTLDAFVDQYMAYGGGDDLAPAMNLYADQVTYFDRGLQPKSTLYEDKHAYFVRWPQRHYQRTSQIATLAEDEYTKQIRFDYHYDLARPDKELSGTAYSVLTLTRENGQVLISGETGAIYPETQVKRLIPQPGGVAAPEQTAPGAPILGLGSSGEDVRQLQRLLNRQGYTSPEDGTFGSQTEAAVTGFQAQHDLDADGVVGRETWLALLQGSTDVPAPVPGRAPKFPQWYFTTCEDDSTGELHTGLHVGVLQRCALVIETVPNGASPVSAKFTYEVEFQQDGETIKKKISAASVWPSSGEPSTTLDTRGDRLIFSLPLMIRARDDRTYQSINAIGEITFDNGATKKVYEKLPVE